MAPGPDPDGIAMRQAWLSKYKPKESASLGQATIIGVDLARIVLQVHGGPVADAEAFVEAAPRPTMRFTPPKPADGQARAVAFRARPDCD